MTTSSSIGIMFSTSFSRSRYGRQQYLHAAFAAVPQLYLTGRSPVRLAAEDQDSPRVLGPVRRSCPKPAGLRSHLAQADMKTTPPRKRGAAARAAESGAGGGDIPALSSTHCLIRCRKSRQLYSWKNSYIPIRSLRS